MIKCNFVYYPRKVYYIIPTIIVTLFDNHNVYPGWTIDIRWLRYMFTIAKFNKK